MLQLPNVSIPSPIILLIPVIVSALCGYLQDDGLPKALNGLLAAIFFLATAGLCLVLGGLITPDIKADIWLYVAYTLVIFNYGPCASLRKMVMDSVDSPLLHLVPSTQQKTQPRLLAVSPTRSTNAALPSQQMRPIQLPGSPDHSG